MGADSGKQRLREYVHLWEANAEVLDKLRDEDIRQADTASSIRMFEQAFRIALRDLPPRSSSGLVAWQDIMRRRRHD